MKFLAVLCLPFEDNSGKEWTQWETVTWYPLMTFFLSHYAGDVVLKRCGVRPDAERSRCRLCWVLSVCVCCRTNSLPHDVTTPTRLCLGRQEGHRMTALVSISTDYSVPVTAGGSSWEVIMPYIQSIIGQIKLCRILSENRVFLDINWGYIKHTNPSLDVDNCF